MTTTSRSKVVSLDEHAQTRSSKLPRASLHSSTLVNRFLEHVTEDPFHQIAENVLATITDPFGLARCAEAIGNREPGGTYYKALLWARIASLVNKESGSANISWFCRVAGVQTVKANEYVRLGLAIEAACAQEECGASLRSAPAVVFAAALRQKQRAVEYLVETARILSANPDASSKHIHLLWCQTHGSYKSRLDIIKPSDWWAFSHPKWRREDDFPGSIPGEIYANALYYFAPQRGVAVDAMAGSGMLRRVYRDRKRWQKEMRFDLNIHLYDLFPRRRFIEKHDARKRLPVKADWIFLDPPYFGQSNHLYEGDLAATTNYKEYLDGLSKVIRAITISLNVGGRLCLFLPKWSGSCKDDPNYDVPSDTATFALDAGLQWIDTAYVSRGRQQEPGSALKNIHAKRSLRMRSDACVLNVFEKGR